MIPSHRLEFLRDKGTHTMLMGEPWREIFVDGYLSVLRVSGIIPDPA